MILFRQFFLAVLVVLVLVFPARSQHVWPSPPERPRITHLQTISSLGDLRIETGFFAKVLNFLVGKHETGTWLVQPVGIAVNAKGKMFIADPGAGGVHVIDRKEKEYFFIQNTAFGLLIAPAGIAAAPDGRVYVSDAERKDVIVLDEDGDAEFHITERLTRPTGLAIYEGALYVVDTHAHKVLVFGLDGTYRGEFGGRGIENGKFNFPVSLTVRDDCYVVDALNYRIQEFDSVKSFLRSFGRQGNASGFFAAPKSIAMDSDGNIYITDALMDNVQIFNASGDLLLVVGGRGTGDGEFMSPSGIAIDAEDNVYVVDSLNKRIQIFRYLK